MPPTKKYRTLTVYDDGSYETQQGEVVDAERVTPAPPREDVDISDISYCEQLANNLDG